MLKRHPIEQVLEGREGWKLWQGTASAKAPLSQDVARAKVGASGPLVGLVAALIGIAVVVATGAYVMVATPPPPPWLTQCGLSYGTTTNSKPMVTLLGSPSPTGEQVTVASMQPDSTWSAYCYQVTLAYNGSYAAPARLTTGSNTTVTVAFGGSPPVVSGDFLVRWIDADANGKLGSGDRFLITHSGGLPSPGAYEFLLVWGDGSTLVFMPFST